MAVRNCCIGNNRIPATATCVQEGFQGGATRCEAVGPPPEVDTIDALDLEGWIRVKEFIEKLRLYLLLEFDKVLSKLAGGSLCCSKVVSQELGWKSKEWNALATAMEDTELPGWDYDGIVPLDSSQQDCGISIVLPRKGHGIRGTVNPVAIGAAIGAAANALLFAFTA